MPVLDMSDLPEYSGAYPLSTYASEEASDALRYESAFLRLIFGARAWVSATIAREMFKAMPAHRRTWYRYNYRQRTGGEFPLYPGENAFEILLERKQIELTISQEHPQVLGWLDQRLGHLRCTACGMAEGECGHVRCEHCGLFYTSVCDACHGCMDCCHCERCADCNRPAGACRCYTSSIESYNPASFEPHGEPTVRFPRLVGTEIEFFYQPGPHRELGKLIRSWGMSAHGDGSIQRISGYAGAKEIATSPARGKALEHQITELCLALRSVDAQVNASCGLHVHVAAKDLNDEQLLAVVRLYSRLEPALYQIVAPSRRRGDYAKPWGDDFDFAQVFDSAASVSARINRLNALMYGDLEEVEHMMEEPDKHSCRYHGMNLNSLLLYGTIEFRLHHGTTNASKILHWAEVCTRIVEYGARHTEQQIAAMTGDAFTLLLKVCGRSELKSWVQARRDHFASQRLKHVGLAYTLKSTLPNVEPAEDSERVTAY